MFYIVLHCIVLYLLTLRLTLNTQLTHNLFKIASKE